jgi:hypothetical protein
VGFASTEERLEVFVSPELLAGGVTARRAAERRAGPAALTAGHIRHKTTIQVRSHAPKVGEPSIGLQASDKALVFIGGFVNLTSAMEEHHRRILRLT